MFEIIRDVDSTNHQSVIKKRNLRLTKEQSIFRHQCITVLLHQKFLWLYVLLIFGKFAGIFLHSVDRFNEDSEHSVNGSGASSSIPLLKEDAIETAETTAEL